MRTRRAKKVTIESEVDPGWVEFVTGGDRGYVDIFYQRSYCGYWMQGIMHDAKLGWLAFEHGTLNRDATPEEKAAAIAAWRGGGALPENFHALSRDFAARAWAKGVQQGGESWYERGDGPAYDAAVQRAAFGDVRYG